MADGHNYGIAISGGGNLTATNLAVGDNATITHKTEIHHHRSTNAEELAEQANIGNDPEKTKSLRDWAGSDRTTLAIVFTDIVDSTAIGQQMKDEAWREVRLAHFAQSRKLIRKHGGHEIKTIGDSFMVVFHAAGSALNYALDLSASTGHPTVKIRAGVHIGALDVEDTDIFGGEVNFAARVIGTAKGSEIWLSDQAKTDLEQAGNQLHRQLKWVRHDNASLKGFAGGFTLWSLQAS